jgi:AcrR family transcriptional regulator
LNVASVRTKSPRKAKGDGHLRRAEILAAAERIFVEDGYEGATIRKIAEVVGVSSTALYMHFPDKRAILLEICRNAFESLIEANHRIRTLPISAREKVSRLLRIYADFAVEQPNTYTLVNMSRPQEAAGGADDVSQQVGMELYELFMVNVRELAAEERLRYEPELVGQVLWAAVHGLVSLWITKPWFDWVERERLLESAVRSLLDGMAER